MSREDGRESPEDLRKITAKVGIIKNAKGSAFFQIGKTAAYAAVYGPRDLHPRFLQNPKTGVLRCNYNMMPFSGTGERIRPGPSRRSKELSLISGKALLPVTDLSDYPNAVVDIFIEIPQADAGTRCAGVCAATMALADAGFKMKDLPVAIACGLVNGEVVADLTYNEEATEGAVDLALTILPRTGEVTLVTMDGEISKDQLVEAIEMGKKVAPKIQAEIRKALLEKYDGGQE
jgi:exosome complex component RRP41